MENSLDFYENEAPPSQSTLHQLYESIDSITTNETTFDGIHHYLQEGVKGKLIITKGNIIHISQRINNDQEVPLISILIVQNNKVICEYQLDKKDDVLYIERYSTLYPLRNNGLISDPLKLERYLGLTKTTEPEIRQLIAIIKEDRNSE